MIGGLITLNDMNALKLLKERIQGLDDVPEPEAKYMCKVQDLDFYLLCKEKGDMSPWKKVKLFRSLH